WGEMPDPCPPVPFLRPGRQGAKNPRCRGKDTVMDKPTPIPAFPPRTGLAGAMALALALPAMPALAADLLIVAEAPAAEGRDWTGPRVGIELPAGARGSLTYTTSTPTTYRF